MELLKLLPLVLLLACSVTANTIILNCTFRIAKTECEYNQDIENHDVIEMNPGESENNINSVQFISSNLSKIPNEIFMEFKIMTTLHVATQNIPVLLPEFFKGADELSTLNIAKNKIKNLPSKVFWHCKKLTNLYLEFNEISDVARDAFNGSNALIILDLQWNKITKLHRNTFESCTRLKTLDLSSNRMKTVTVILFKNDHALEIRLSNNKVNEIQNNFLDSMNEKVTLTLKNNECINDSFQNVEKYLVLYKKQLSTCFTNYNTQVINGIEKDIQKRNETINKTVRRIEKYKIKTRKQIRTFKMLIWLMYTGSFLLFLVVVIGTFYTIKLVGRMVPIKNKESEEEKLLGETIDEGIDEEISDEPKDPTECIDVHVEKIEANQQTPPIPEINPETVKKIIELKKPLKQEKVDKPKRKFQPRYDMFRMLPVKKIDLKKVDTSVLYTKKTVKEEDDQIYNNIC